MLEIKIYGSKCATTDFYKEYFEGLFIDEGIKANFEIIQDADKMELMGLDIGCMYGYCPGCNNAHLDLKENEKYVPAIVVNDKILYHSFFPKKDVALEIVRTLK